MSPAVTTRRSWKHAAAGAWTCVDDEIAVEEPLEIRLRGQPVAIIMRTPGHDEDLIAGFLLSEGVIRSASDIVHIRPCHAAAAESVDVLLAPSVSVDLARLSRHVMGSASCGVCGAASIDAVLRQAQPAGAGPRLSPALLAGLPERLRAEQAGFARTGGLHAAALLDAGREGAELLVVREDVGRHNAVDKAVGSLLRRGARMPAQAILTVSGRASFEIVQKALVAGVAAVVAISAPSSLAVDLAEQSNITLVGFARGDAFTVYTHPRRVEGSERVAHAPR